GANMGGPGVNILFNGDLVVTNSTFTNNVVNNATANVNINGGAIAFSAQAPVAGQTFTVDINKNTFTGNSADGFGGAISANNSFGTPIANMKINYNRFVGNTAAASSTTSGLHYVNSAGSVNAENNWWGCNTGPSAAGTCDRAAGIGAPG